MRAYGIKRVGTRVLDDKVVVFTHYMNGKVDVDFGDNTKHFGCCQTAEEWINNDWIRKSRMVSSIPDN